MSPLLLAIGLYMAATVAIGLYASRRVHGAKDFMVAGRSLPFYMNFACVFATWFGAETLLSISATFARDGLSGISGDPFGAAFCLAMVGLFFARSFYRMNLLTIGDFYHKRYGKVVEVITSLAITLSYLGWTSAQMTALGLVLYVLGGGAFTLNQAILIGSVVVSIYTLFGGMWSVALTDLVQTAAIVLGLLLVAYFLAGQAGGVGKVLQQASEAGKFRFFPEGDAKVWWAWAAAFITFGLGSIPQQDVFQRVTSAKDEKTAVAGTLTGGFFYFLFAFIPMFIAYAAVVIDPAYNDLFASEDSREIQRILPDLILKRTPLWTQVLFFGALLSAILSTASGTLLAPSSLFTENVIQPFIKHLDDKHLLWALRTVLVLFSIAATWFAVNSTSTMYEMVQNAYKVTLVAAFVPLAFGVFWPKASTQGALFSILLGLGTWLAMEKYLPESSEHPWAIVPPQIVGLGASILGMLAGGLLPQWIPSVHLDDEEFQQKQEGRKSVASH
ncbi:MAG: sodium:solute symporter family protein [Pirellulaceae bacterium]